VDRDSVGLLIRKSLVRAQPGGPTTTKTSETPPRSEQALALKLALKPRRVPHILANSVSQETGSDLGGLRGREPFEAANRSAKVFGCEVRVAHRHGQRSMAEEFLQFFERHPAHD